MATLRIGIIGANPDHGWAFRAHIPALDTLRRSGAADLALTAVATSKTGSAQEAARLTGAAPFTSATDLAASPDVDLVVITVKVSAHRELVETALAAGKHVLCEWPLGLDATEAAELASATGATQRGFTGLQARLDPAAIALSDAISAGDLGEIQAVTVRSSRAKGSGELLAENRYTLDRVSGAGAREVHTGHLFDLLDQVTGGIDVTSGTAAVHRQTYRVAGQRDLVIATAPDTVTAAFTVGRGLGSATIWDGDSRAETVITIAGTLGRARLRTLPVAEPIMRQVQIAPMRADIHLDGYDAPYRLETTAYDALAGLGIPVQARNVAAQYLTIAADLADDGTCTATFDDAVRIHRFIDTLDEDAPQRSAKKLAAPGKSVSVR